MSISRSKAVGTCLELDFASGSAKYSKETVDYIVTFAGGSWYFFEARHFLDKTKSRVDLNEGSVAWGNVGRDRWDLVGLDNHAGRLWS